MKSYRNDFSRAQIEIRPLDHMAKCPFCEKIYLESWTFMAILKKYYKTRRIYKKKIIAWHFGNDIVFMYI